jgi:hypothetical protein
MNVEDIRCPGCGGEHIEVKQYKNWTELKDKARFYWVCNNCKMFFKTKRFFMQFTEIEHVELHWALTYALDALKCTAEDLRANAGLEPAPELLARIKRLEKLYDRFKRGA